ncbi:MAG: phosphomethylpyrimidine synthase ThiC [Nitrospirae bacterium]|nr:phosphomethylpyrimidine synthase ThiC [Nitrospirota bacterium]NTW67064.1 phosphomethylpyrimidine synthase ThiC [Nitrospirota bacterium]
MNQIIEARKGNITPEMEAVARAESVSSEHIRGGIENGTIVITRNNRHRNITPLGVGRGLRTKINANIGTSKDRMSIPDEIEKLKVAVAAGADAVMDLSTGGPIIEIRKEILKQSTVAIGTVPIYQAAVETVGQGKSIVQMDPDLLFRVIDEQAEEGVDFITVHCGVTRESVERLRTQGRIMDVVSRGGAFHLEWIITNDAENPLYEQYDRLLEIAKKYDVTLSLGDGMRPGCLADATDRAQIQELITLGELRDHAHEAGVQVMIEGPGHVPINQVETNIRIQKELCKGAPFYVLGPLVTDVAPGYDHITSAIGGAIAGAAGADFLCYVTPSEHLRLPDLEDVRDGVIASRIAAHAADIAKGVPGAMEWDREMARRRKALDWKGQIELSINPDRARKLRESSLPKESDVCSMCGEFCSMKGVSKYLKKDGRKKQAR